MQKQAHKEALAKEHVAYFPPKLRRKYREVFVKKPKDFRNANAMFPFQDLLNSESNELDVETGRQVLLFEIEALEPLVHDVKRLVNVSAHSQSVFQRDFRKNEGNASFKDENELIENRPRSKSNPFKNFKGKLIEKNYEVFLKRIRMNKFNRRQFFKREVVALMRPSV